MAQQFIEPIYHTNSADTETAVESLESTTEEPKRIVGLVIATDTNGGILKLYKERDNFASIVSGALDASGPYFIAIDLELEVGKTFSVTLTNRTAGSNAVIQGWIVWELTA